MDGLTKMLNIAFGIGVEGFTLHIAGNQVFYPTPSVDSGTYEKAG